MAPEENIHFENRYHLTAKTLRPFFWKMASGRRYLYSVALALSLGLLLVWAMHGGDLPYIAIILIFTSVTGILLPFFNAKKAARDHCKVMNGDHETILRFTDTGISGNIAQNEQNFQYSQLCRVRSTRSMWLLLISKRVAILVLKEGFTRGDAGDFPAFIRSKCPGIKVPNN